MEAYHQLIGFAAKYFASRIVHYILVIINLTTLLILFDYNYKCIFTLN